MRVRRPDGKYDSKTFASRPAAERFERAKLAARDRGEWIDPRQARRTLRDVAAEWLDSNPAKRESTRSRDEIAIRVHIVPTLGDRPISSITPSDVQTLVNAWPARSKPRTVGRNYGVLRAVRAMATEHDLISRSPCRGIKLPKPARYQPALPGTDLVRKLAAAVGEDYGAMVWIGALLGLRWGEVAGLRIRSFDALRGTISVTEQIGRGTGGRRAITPPKSDAGRRTLHAPQAMTGLLAGHLARRCLTAANADEFLFVAPKGGPLDYSHWRRRVFLPACVSVGLGEWRRDLDEAGEPTGRILGYDGIGFHDLRRLNATLGVTGGVDPTTMKARLGHSDVRLTLALYTQATAESDASAAQTIAAAFEPAEPAVETTSTAS